MRKISYIVLLSFGMSLTAQAQTTAQTAPQEKSPEISSKTSQEKAPSKEATTSEPSKTGKDIEGGIDLERFFKKGEENAKNGASCNKPATPADPIA